MMPPRGRTCTTTVVRPAPRWRGTYDDHVEIIVLTLAVGIGVGIVVGALGAGGGILAVPVLVYLLGQDPHDATAMSLIVVGITSLASLRHHARIGNVAWHDGLVFAAVAALGAVLGSRLQGYVGGGALMVMLAVLLLGVSAAMLVKGLRTRRDERAAVAAQASPQDSETDKAHAEREDAVLDSPGPEHVRERAPGSPTSWPSLIAAASTTGLLTGFFGVGGGFIVVPMLVLALGLAMPRATGTSLLVMLMTTVIALAARIGTDVQINWLVTLLFAGASAVGGSVGGPLSSRLRPSTLTLVFAALLAAVAVVTLSRTLVG